MNKIIIVLCGVLAVVCAKDNSVDDYAASNYDNYKRTLDGYDSDLQRFRKEYEGHVESVVEKRDFVLDRVIKTKESFHSLTLLSGLHKRCISKYSERVTNVQPIKDSYGKCVTVASSEFSTVLYDAVALRDALEYYLKNDYRNNVGSCEGESSCVEIAVRDATNFAYDNQKSFRFALEAADCLAKANVKRVVDCTFSIEYELSTTLGAVHTLIEECLVGKDECKPCLEYTCGEAINFYDHDNQTIANPIYNRKDSPKCLMLNVH